MSLLPNNKKNQPARKQRSVLSGSCPDPRCQARLFFPASHASVAGVECTDCGQRHEQKSLVDVREELSDPDVALHNLLRHALLGGTSGGVSTGGVTGATKKGPEMVKVMGLSNYHCKLLSPVLTRYGMDKQTGKAKLLREMNQGEMFDCSLLGDRAFLIEPEHISTIGYGKDRSGSLVYLHDTLEEVKKANKNNNNNNSEQDCLIPVHVDGDGHCLVHAVSRALVGRELFWHALRENLKQNFKQNLDRYKALFQDFIDSAEWEDIINECDPLFVPPEGVPLGLRNIHIFGLANVLHRPIILLDSLSGMRSSGDYSATFLPGLVSEEQCKGRDGTLNKPICIAWSSSGRNHYIPLVGVRNETGVLPRLPSRLVPKAWGVPQELIRVYVKVEADGSVVIGGDRSLQDKYLMRLVNAMEEVFMEKHSIHPSLVADVHQYIYRRTGVIGIQPEEVTEAAKRSLNENRLHRCLVCGALSELHVLPEWLIPGGKLYNLAKSTHGNLRPDKNYSFPLNSIVCSYDEGRDVLVPDYKLSSLNACGWCHGTSVRHIQADGTVVYLDGDRTNTPSHGGKCGCGFKHFWEEKEFDNLPEAFPITLEWNGRVVRETVYWFQYEADPALNSNVYDVAMKLVTKHFPGEFGSEILVQKVVNTILHHTAKKNPDEYNPVRIDGAHTHRLTDTDKIILTGQKSKTLHKEELTVSRAERNLQSNIKEQAAANQKRRTERVKQDNKVTGVRSSSPIGSDSPSSAPATPTKTPSTNQKQEKKIRVTTSDGRQAMLTLQINTTFSDLQRSIQSQFDISPSQQFIRYGFPPKELLPPDTNEEEEEEKKNTPLTLQHGDRVTVEILRGAAMTTTTTTTTTEDSGSGGTHTRTHTQGQGVRASSSLHSVKQEEEERSRRNTQTTNRELQESIDLEMSSLCLLATLMGEDVWSYAKKLPHLFQQGGVFYNIVKKDMGLMDGKHCTLPHLTGKTFVFNSSEDRLELCVDASGHFPVGPDVDELVKEKEAQLQRSDPSTRGSRESSPSHSLKLGSGGVVRKKELQNVTAFQGKGHSLGSSSPPDHHHHHQHHQHHRPITRQHSSGVDLSSSVSRNAPNLSDVPEHTTRELVRMAPGFVTMAKDGQGPGQGGRASALDPSVMEQQRKKLQEMVSSIQASMEKHLKDQQEQLKQQKKSATVPTEQQRTDGVINNNIKKKTEGQQRPSTTTTTTQPTTQSKVAEIGAKESSNAAGGCADGMVALSEGESVENLKKKEVSEEEEEEEMESQDAEQQQEQESNVNVNVNVNEPMDHS